MTVTAYIALGSNLDDPVRQVETALEELAGLPDSRLTAGSPLYRSAPMGPPDQPDYINAAARLVTALGPEALLDALQGIEDAHGRVRDRRWGPRSLDLDILLYGDRGIASERLTVPHPGLPERNFVLYPLADIDPDLEVPGAGSLRDLLRRAGDAGIERLDSSAT